LVQKGKIAEAENVLRKLRGTASVEEELDAIINTCELNASHGNFAKYINSFIFCGLCHCLLYIHGF